MSQALSTLTRPICSANDECRCVIDDTSGSLYKILLHGIVAVDRADDVARSTRLLADTLAAAFLLAAGRFDVAAVVTALAPARACTAEFRVDMDERSFIVTVARR